MDLRVAVVVILCVYGRVCWYILFFFFKQKTAYEMRISDWSSDVCSSDLVDTCHFKGNYPDRCSIQAAFVPESTPASMVTQSMFWSELLPAQKLQMDQQHFYRNEIAKQDRKSVV